jgi:pilus assembly protein FimV
MKRSLLFIRAIVVAVLCLSATTYAVGQATQIQGPSDAADVYSGVVYGPVDRSDTLWAISSQYRKNQQFTVYQVMLAIYELNPRGFVNRNFNTMVNGTTLQLPTNRYIARIDPKRARVKAEQDDRAFTQTTGREGQSANETSDGQAQTENLKQEVPLVNKEELDATQKQFQQQINSLKRQQINTVNDLKKQLGESIQATQIIVDDNKLVLRELAKKDAEFIVLKTELSKDFQSKLDEQAAQIQELREFFAMAKMKEQAQENDSFGNLIRKPVFMVIAASVVFFFLFVLIAISILRKPINAKAKAGEGTQDLDDVLIEQKASNDADDLLAILEKEDISDDDLLDDILSDDLEDSFDEVALNTNDFSDINNELLVPEQRGKVADDDLSDTLLDLDSLDGDTLDAEFDGIDLGDEKVDTDGVDNISDQLDDFDGLDADPQEVDIDSILDEQSVDISQVEAEAIKQLSEGEKLSEEDSLFVDNLTQSDLSASQDDDEQSEIDIDDLLEHNALDGSTPKGVSSNVSGQIDEKVIGQIEAEIAERNIELNTLTENFYEELTNNDPLDDDLDFDTDNDDLDSSNTGAASPEQQKSIRPFDGIIQGVEDDIADAIENIENDDTLDSDSPLAGQLLKELAVDSPNDVDSEIEDLLTQPITHGINDLDLDSILESSLNELQTGTIDFEQHDELTDDLEDALRDKAVLLESDQSYVELAEDGNEQPEHIDIDSVLDDSLNDFINNQLEDDEFDRYSSTTIEKLYELKNDPDTSFEALDAEVEIKQNQRQESDNISDEIDAKQSDATGESDEDLLDLPGLDDWLDEDDKETIDNEIGQALDKFSEANSEDDVLREIEEADFDLLLAEMDSLSDEQTATEIEKLYDGDDGVLEVTLKEQATETLDNLDLDLAALFDESVIDNSKDFIDVDSLLQESDNVTPATDDELALDLDMSLDKFLNDEVEIDVDIDADQASNLDLARVYVDMEDNEAAIEALDEVVQKGNDEQKEEALALLKQLRTD